MAAVVCFKPQRAAHTFNRSLPRRGERVTQGERFNCGFRGLFPMWWCHCVSKPSLQGACTLSEGLSIVAARMFSVISRPSFNCAAFIFGIHLFSFGSSSVSALPWSMPILCSLVLSISSFPALTTYISLLSINISVSEILLRLLRQHLSSWIRMRSI